MVWKHKPDLPKTPTSEDGSIAKALYILMIRMIQPPVSRLVSNPNIFRQRKKNPTTISILGLCIEKWNKNTEPNSRFKQRSKDTNKLIHIAKLLCLLKEKRSGVLSIIPDETPPLVGKRNGGGVPKSMSINKPPVRREIIYL